MEMLRTLGVNWMALLAQFVNFAVLLGALSFLLYRPILRMLDERRDRVRESIQHAEKLEKEVQQMEHNRKKRLKEIDEQAKAFLEDAKKQAELQKKEILESAKMEVDQMLHKGKQQLENERQTLLSDLQKTVTSVSVDLAQKILQREFSASDQQRLLKELEKDVPSLIQ